MTEQVAPITDTPAQSPHLAWLAQHMQHSDTLAEWLHRQLSYEYAHQPLGNWQREFAVGRHNGDWQVLEPFQAWDKQQWLTARPL